MTEKSNLIVLEKREVFLVFVFMILTAVISFSLGFKVGKNLSYTEEGFIQEDREVIKMQSDREEEASKVSDQENQLTRDELEALSKESLKNEMSAVTKEAPVHTSMNKAEEVKPKERTSPMSPPEEVLKREENIQEEAAINYVGKWTIQLGSFPEFQEAQQFADGFRVLGYDPIIYEVSIPEKGNWYRVSMGSFDTVSEAKSYIEKENTLFKGQDYVILKFQ
jgi:cell division protein FtsN